MARRSSSYSKPRGAAKSKYSALYVGSSACSELPSVDDVARGVRDLVRGGGGASASSTLPRLALTVSGKGLKVVRHGMADRGARRRRREERGAGPDTVRHPLTEVRFVQDI